MPSVSSCQALAITTHDPTLRISPPSPTNSPFPPTEHSKTSIFRSGSTTSNIASPIIAPHRLTVAAAQVGSLERITRWCLLV